MLCPECETRVKSLEKLKPDEDRRERAKKYVDEMLESGKELAEQEKKEREAEEEREKAAQEKAAAAKAEAEKAAGEVKKEEGGTPEVKEEAVEEDEKELFPVKPEEVRFFLFQTSVPSSRLFLRNSNNSSEPKLIYLFPSRSSTLVNLASAKNDRPPRPIWHKPLLPLPPLPLPLLPPPPLPLVLALPPALPLPSSTTAFPSA
jgi:hypothetical protein